MVPTHVQSPQFHNLHSSALYGIKFINQLRLESFSAFANFQIKRITKTHEQIYKIYHNI
jgi:hypothetical protein